MRQVRMMAEVRVIMGTKITLERENSWREKRVSCIYIEAALGCD